MHDEKQALAEWFVCQVVQAQNGIETRIIKAVIAIERLLDEGWTILDIQQAIQEFASTYPDLITKVYHLEEVIGNRQPPNNLLERDVFYYHNILREVPPPPRIRFVDGKPVREEQPFYLEMKKRFTLEDLLQYWYNSNGVSPNDHMRRQDEGKFKYLLGIYNLDEILFAIDVSKTMRAEQQLPPLRNAFELERYMEEARKFIEGKKNVHQLQGINRVIKKRDAT
jgi:hypothetical protein